MCRWSHPFFRSMMKSGSICGVGEADVRPRFGCRKRSPLTYLERARGVPIDVNHGIRDGRNAADPVPVSQSLIAFNLLAQPQDRVTEEEIAYFTREAQVPAALRSETTDPAYGGLRILFRRESGNARVTIFDGAHDKNTEAAFRWLNRQRRSR